MTTLKLQTELERLRDRLLDLSMRNPLLNYRKSKRRTLQIIDELPSVIHTRLVDQGKSFRLDFVEESSPQPSAPPGGPPDRMVGDPTLLIPGNASKGLQESSGESNGRQAEDDSVSIDVNTTSGPQTSKEVKASTNASESLQSSSQPPVSLQPPVNGESEGDGCELPETPVHRDAESKHLFDDRLRTNLTREQLDSLVRYIRREAATALQETGINYLHLALGFLSWRESEHSSTERLAPLVLIPIQIETLTDGRTGETSFEIRWTEDDVNGNPTLLKKLQRDFGIQIPDYDIDSDCESYLAEVSQRTARKEHWSVKREALIGFFSFHKLSMYQDLATEQWIRGDEHSNASVLEQIICGAKGSPADDISMYARDYSIDENEVANEIILAMDADSSQHSALCDIREGKNLVIEGPPGTGKSQTISNAIADAIASGKTVLFVAEKLTALQVVHDRLGSLGLGDFCLELHSDSASPRHVYESLHQRLTATYSTPDELQTYRDGLAQLRQRLNRYVDEMAQPVGPNAEPLYDLIWQIVELRSQGAVPFATHRFADGPCNQAELQQATTALDSFASKLSETPDPLENPWWGFFTDPLAFNTYPKIAETLQKIQVHLEQFRNLARRFESVTGVQPHSLRQNAIDVAGSRLNEVAQLAPIEAISKFRELASPNTLNQTHELLKFIAQRNDALGEFEAGYSVRYSAVADSIFSLTELLENLGSSNITVDEILRAIDDWKAKAMVPAIPSELTDHVSIRIDTVPRSGALSVTAAAGNVIPFFDLFQMLDWGKGATEAVQRLIDFRETIRLPGDEVVTNFADFHRAYKLLQLIHHPAIRKADVLTQKQFSNEGRRDYRDAKEKFDELCRTRELLEKLFHLPSVPTSDSVSEISRTLRRHHSSWFRLLNRDYRQAKARLQEFVAIGSRRSTADRIGDLDALNAYLQECQLFANDARFRESLGILFQGIETNWDALKTVFDWVHTIQRYNTDYLRCQQLIRERDALAGEAGLSKLRQLNDSFEKVFLLENSDRPQSVVISDPREIPLEQLRSDLAGLCETIEQAIEKVSESAKQLAALLVTCQIPPRSLENLHTMLKDLKTLHQIETRLHAPEEWQRLVDSGIHSEALGNFEKVAQASRWFSEVKDAINELPEGLLSKFFESDDPISRMQEVWSIASLISQTHQSLLASMDILSHFAETTSDWIDLSDVSLLEGALQSRIERMSDSVDGLPAWSAFCQALQACRKLGLDEYCYAALRGEVAGGLLSACYRLTVFQRIAETSFRSSSLLPQTTGVNLDALRREFQKYDRKLRELNRSEIAVRASQREVPAGNSRGRVGELTELSLIRHETQKQRRHCRIRDLIQRAGTATQALKPCFMMSPLSVSRFIPQGTITFDIVIMDEASQIKPEDAVGTILRGNQLVVVGDPKQLPPTSFFDRIEEEVEDDESTLIDNTESILEASMKVFQPFRRLRWHYRSRHESLIRFSNYSFYDNDLVVFPSNSGDDSKTGVSSVYVENATCTAGANVREAEAIVDAILHHAITSPSESLGVGTFNKKQAELIYELLEKRCSEDPKACIAVDRLSDNKEELFIKNLENVQGDERDVIFVGYTYGPDPASGRLFQRFGPINAVKGWRRLNVLITRSRKRMVVFHSFMPNDILGGPDKSRGVNAYKDFLSYAMSGRLDEQGSVLGRQPHSPFETAVCRTIEAMGLEAVPQVGVAGFFVDIGVRRREGDRSFILGVECDGATYHSARSARDRDRLREEIITSRGWNIHRIWSTDWFLNQTQEEERLRRAIRNLLDS